MRINYIFRVVIVHAVLAGLALQASLTVSCSLVRTSDPRALSFPPVAIPSVPEGGDSVWRLRWLSGNGNVECRYLENTSDVFLDVCRERPLIVTASPVSGVSGFSVLPAGCLSCMPGDKSQTIALTWADGYAADYLLNLAAVGIDPQDVNVDRFREAARSRGGDNPWFLDTRRLSSDLTDGNLWIYSFRLKDCVDVLLPLAPGEWYSRYVPAPVMPAGIEGWAGSLPPGTHCFFNPAGNQTVTATVDDDGRVVSIQG